MCVYNQLRPSRATAAQSGGVWAAPTGRTAAGKSDPIGKQSRVVGQYTKPRCSCRGTAHITVFYVSATNVLPWRAFTGCADVPRSRTIPRLTLSNRRSAFPALVARDYVVNCARFTHRSSYTFQEQAVATITGGTCPVGFQSSIGFTIPFARSSWVGG